MKPPWYGGNKIPASYLAKFRTKTEDDDLPWELRMFLSDTTKGADHGNLSRHTTEGTPAGTE